MTGSSSTQPINVTNGVLRGLHLYPNYFSKGNWSEQSWKRFLTLESTSKEIQKLTANDIVKYYPKTTKNCYRLQKICTGISSAFK